MQDTRFESLKLWLKSLSNELGILIDSITPASNDASFRRYFRVLSSNKAYSSFIVMDAPPDKEDSNPFIHVANLLLQAQITVPKIYEKNINEGFLLLSDLGNDTLLMKINSENAANLYKNVAATLIKIQKNTKTDHLPVYNDELLRRELMLFPDWYLKQHLEYKISDKELVDLNLIFDEIIKNNVQQPSVFVHRDFHSRNLMIISDDQIGVLDFQDAVIGPITYDLVSVFRDAYIEWDEEQQMDWVIRYWESAKKEGLPVNEDFGEFYKDFEWMGLQRHLKVLGIFARLYHRDGKEAYLKNLPLVLQYTEKVAQRYSSFKPLVRILDNAHNLKRPDGLTF
jgi:aminoglycoside/choline kinase family phosphotransferase